MEPENNLPPQTGTAESEATKLTPELVQKVADKVYALWQRELRYEQERTYRYDDHAALTKRWQR